MSSPARPLELAVGPARGYRLASSDSLQGKDGICVFAERLLGFPLETQQRALLQSAGRRVILNCTRQWGKSWMAAVAVLHHALTRAGAMVVVAGPGLRQSGELFLKVKALARRMGVRTKRDGVNALSAVFPNESRVVAVPATKDRIVGFSGVTMLAIDEAAMVKDDVYFAVRPMLVQSRGTVWLLSTPRAREGFFWREYSEGEGWERVEVKATESARFGAAELEEEERAMGAKLFAREFLCQFVALDDGLFSEEWLAEVFWEGVGPLEKLW